MSKAHISPASVQDSSLYIVLADDDADDREMFMEAVGEIRDNVAVSCAEDGNHLLALLDSETKCLPHIIFLDLNMPNKNGKECLVEIRKAPNLQHIPIVIYSTSTSPSDIDDTFEKGANLYLRKPYSYNDLIVIMQKILIIDWKQQQPQASRNAFVFSLRASY